VGVRINVGFMHHGHTQTPPLGAAPAAARAIHGKGPESLLATHGDKLQPATIPPKRDERGNKQTRMCTWEKEWWATGVDLAGVRTNRGLFTIHKP
jgi:hypothetical protein